MSTLTGAARWVTISLLLPFTFVFTLQTGSAAAQQPSDDGRIIKRVKIVAPKVTGESGSKPTPVDKKITVKPPAPKPVVKKPVIKPLQKRVVKKTPKKRVKTVKPAKRAQKRVKSAKRSAIPTSVRGGQWAINVASYVSKEDATEYKKKLQGAGYDAYTVEFSQKEIVWHRLRVGFYYTRDDAKRVAQQLGKQFHIDDVWVVKPSASEVSTYRK